MNKSAAEQSDEPTGTVSQAPARLLKDIRPGSQARMHNQRPAEDTYSETARYYDRLSRWYDLLSGPAENTLRLAGLQMLDLQPGERLLEIGSGTGKTLLAAAGQVMPAGQVVGVDISYGMCHESRRQLRRQPASVPIVNLIQGHALQLPLAPGFFDAIFMSFTLELFPACHFSTVLSEVRRVAAPASRLGIVSLAQVNPLPWMARAYTWLHNHYPKYLDCRPIPLAEVLTSAGFSLHTCETKRLFGLPVAMAVCSG